MTGDFRGFSRRFAAAWSVLAMAGFGWAAPAWAGLSYQEGLAKDPASQALLYREEHWTRHGEDGIGERIVLYRCADGTAFARKRIDYRRSTVAPDFRFEDRRFDYVEGLRWNDGPAVYVREGGAGREKAATLAPARLVADAGFDEFIRRQWPSLVAGRDVPLAFAIPARQQSIGFTLKRIGAADFAGEPAWVFRLSLSGWLRFLAPHVDVLYSQRTQRLLRFEGPSNLRNDAGRAPLNARIDFARPPRDSAEAEWAAALSVPLSTCRTGR
ncbi:hypothetical protein [Arenimonas sp.]|uniref:hypothetical protein n=1 Tax=Arenimonas sp. TaxID=1872635 RepID=UPI0039E299D0